MPARKPHRDAAAWIPPDQTGRVVVVTGANSGIGFWTSLALARAGARVVLACRSESRAGAAVQSIRAAVPGAALEVLRLDLADLASVRAAAAELRARHDRIDVLVNNAGIALTPYARTVDGFESHLAANFLGPFALTGLVLDLLVATPGSRVVQVGSLAHRVGRIRYDDLHFDRRRYVPWTAYSQSKLADVVFLLELERRLRIVGAPTIAVGGHPGASVTGIAERLAILRVPGVRSLAHWLEGRALNVPELGADASVRAAADPALTGGSYLGPIGFGEVLGPAGPARLAARARVDGPRLWATAEELTGVRYLD